ncbi:hypothetical protein [Streptomyces sp. NBC_00038]|uniref:hypothetical protein n=1 Tax=Streptomyces sp. NBC_00038 TaxID=2903615 RepID=UPI0022517AB5|nr:hypothetical protein [Streptomyces sp. NBC_00038]MCX5557429.1 hypothetical protein [Streptomyces sp. NBC_00038]
MPRAVIAIALAAAVAAIAACGGVADGSAESKSSAVSRGPLTEAQLTAALPVGSDLPGFTAELQSAPLLEAQDIVTTGQSACRPIADMMSVRPRYPRQAMVWATLRPDGAPEAATPGSVTLTSHRGDGAAAGMAELKEAAVNCTGFTATSQRGWTHRFIVTRLPQARVGDDAVSYLITNVKAPGGEGNVMTVVRTGSTFATYLLPPTDGESQPVPESVAARQHMRIRVVAD